MRLQISFLNPQNPNLCYFINSREFCDFHSILALEICPSISVKSTSSLSLYLVVVFFSVEVFYFALEIEIVGSAKAHIEGFQVHFINACLAQNLCDIIYSFMALLSTSFGVEDRLCVRPPGDLGVMTNICLFLFQLSFMVFFFSFFFRLLY